MAEIARIPLDFDGEPAAAWDRLAAHAQAWLEQTGVPARDAVVLVPLAQHLPLARRAFGRLGGWLPRVETLRTLASGLPPVQRPEGAVSFDPAHDRLRARQTLRSQAWARDWSDRDPRAFDETLGRLVDCAHRLAQRSAAIPPLDRPAWVARGRALLSAGDDPGGTERLLARVAFEWVAASAPWPTDNLYALEAKAWVAVHAGGSLALVEALLQSASSAGIPCLTLDADPQGEDPLSTVRIDSELQYAACEDFEDEAERTAAHLLAWLAQDCKPLVLVAQDRVLVRRVGALLARHRVPVLDETGWKLSTTRAAAGLMALLRAASPVASTDELLDWLKSLPAPDGLPPHAVDQLEQTVRRRACTRRDRLATLELEGPAQAARDWAQQRLEPLGTGRSTLADWMRQLREVLHASGQWAALQQDPAGLQVLAALRLESADASWNTLAESMPLRWAEFMQAVDEMLEQAVFEPPAPHDTPAVVITPLRRALLRPFAAAVLPAADDRRLGAPVAPDPLLGEALSVALGLAPAAEHQRDEAAAFAQLLRLPQVLLSSRHHDEGEVLEPSVLVERLMLLREQAGAPIGRPDEPRRSTTLQPSPQQRPAPSAAARVPATLSASTVEALRDCPYRFFSRSMLGLREPDELDDEAEKRDYGNWLHAVLLRFHEQRPEPRSIEQDLAALQTLALQERDAQGLADASFLPFEASFERFAPRYAEWVQQRDAEGGRWLEGETEREVASSELGLTLKGRLDRVDVLPGGERQLIDYKTVPYQTLSKRVREPLEDTQLAFYAALEMLREDEAPPPAIEAAYLALDDSEGIKTVPHAEVEQSARVLLDSLAQELRRMREGAPLPALGEGVVCERCEARGLCRRDHWADPFEGTR